MSRRNISYLAVVLLFLGTFAPLFLMTGNGIDWEPALKSFASDADIAFATHEFDLLQSHKFDEIEKSSDPNITRDRSQLVALANYIPFEPPSRVKLVGVHKFTSGSRKLTDISLEYQYSHDWLVFECTTQGDMIVGMHIMPLKDSIEHLSRFTFEGKAVAHYIAFAIALWLIGFDAYALALCINTPMRRRKWAWVLFILTGFCTVQFNWMTGQIIGPISHTDKWLVFNFFSVQWPVANFSQMAFAPLILKLSVPLGAIIFLLRRKKLTA